MTGEIDTGAVTEGILHTDRRDTGAVTEGYHTGPVTGASYRKSWSSHRLDGGSSGSSDRLISDIRDYWTDYCNKIKVQS